MRILASPAFSNAIVNPYNALLYGEMNSHGIHVIEYSLKQCLLNKFSILHFHWPDGYINQKSIVKSIERIVILALSIILASIKGSKIIWTVHNIEPHDAFHPKLAKKSMQWFAKHCDGFIFLNEESRKTFLKIYSHLSESPYSIIPHGHYRPAYRSVINQTEAKAQLKLPSEQNILLCLGMIKPYKNVDQLIRLFSEIKLDNWTLVIAGQPESPALQNSLTRMAAGNPKIKLIFQFIANDEIPSYLSAADAVILPYKNLLNSGALLLALSFDKPVIAPLSGAAINLQADIGEEWIYGYSGDLTRTQLIIFLNVLNGDLRNAQCPLETYNWDAIGQKTCAFYKRLMNVTLQENRAICH